MSSRALRRLQREQEEQKDLALLQEENASETDEEQDQDELPHLADHLQKKGNAFDFLNSANDEESDDDDDDDHQPEKTLNEVESSKDLRKVGGVTAQDSGDGVGDQSDRPRKKKSKKKKKKAAKGKASQSHTPAPEIAKEQPELDEIDLALKSLKVKGEEASEDGQKPALDTGLQRLYKVLATDSKHLNALNEMKKLFGNIVLETENEGEARPAGRRRGRRQELVDLGGALAGINSPASRGQRLAGLVLRKNIFMPGKEEWPKGTSGGLGMEIVERAEDFTIEYRFVHNKIYQGVQRQFDTCVESMDPQRMIQLLQFNRELYDGNDSLNYCLCLAAYHISTLLQVAEIAKHQGDHSVSADLLERALFTFGRSVHTTFQTALSEGKARLDFRRPENREFWLAAWRYITSLGKRGTWRTAYEWSKLLLSFDPEGDPYRMRMIIDQLAVRGGQFEQFIDLASTPTSVVDWGQKSPNIQISLAMAHYKVKQGEESRRILSLAVKNYPWVFDRLIKELNIENIKNSTWGQVPRTPYEELQTATYVERAKDIWNTPEALSLLVEVIETTKLTESPPPPNSEDVITINEARHILLSEVPSLLALLPRTFTTQRTSASDPLPPEDNLPSYGSFLDVEQDETEPIEQETQASRQDTGTVRSWVVRMLSRLGIQPEAANGTEGSEEQQEDVNAQQELSQGVNEVVQAMENQELPLREMIDRGAQLGWIEGDQLALEFPAGAWDDLLPQNRNRANVEDNDSEIESEAVQNLLVQAARPERNVPAAGRLPQAPAPESRTDETTAESSSQEPNNPAAYDDEANQRWLAGRGMLRLKDFIAEHGSDEKVWQHSPSVDTTPATEYVRRLRQLRERSSKDFILNYALKQGAGAEATDLIKRLLGQ